ncbi:hypothetical protein [Pseudonocardia parietis]|uniref:Antibiotic biosynthesis monooxygenase n=1 Tax=Pseudonocardia parietis TaxID=570936 RepID=A0ABS4VLU0_9PSEU|nr:hypothetical protein [Pseudonocardia parietis]MBP2364892.1 hypothetical protein [Pseudonocardia parietis]
MYVRVTSIYCDQAPGVHQAMDSLERVDRPAVEAARGNRGLMTVVDREAGVLVAASYWDEPGLASQASLTQARGAATEAAGGDMTTETFEVAAELRCAELPSSGVLRVFRARSADAPSDLPARVEWVIFPQLATLNDFCAAELRLAQDGRRPELVTMWSSAAAATAGAPEVWRLLSTSKELEARFDPAEEYAVIGPCTPAELGTPRS